MVIFELTGTRCGPREEIYVGLLMGWPLQGGCRLQSSFGFAFWLLSLAQDLPFHSYPTAFADRTVHPVTLAPIVFYIQD